MRILSTLRRLWLRLPPLGKGFILSFACWGIVAGSLGAQAAGRPGGSWTDAMEPGVQDCLPWAIFSPLIFQLVQWLPIDSRRWRLALPVHLLSGVATVALCLWWKGIAPLGPIGILRALAGHGGRAPALLSWPSAADFFDGLRAAIFEAPVYLMLVSGAHTLAFYRRTQERESSLALARAQAQKMQLQPHFLFNALNMIAELVHEDPDKADAMLTALSGLLRLTMDTAGEQELPLRRELEFVERYLAIMHARFEDRLAFQLGIDPATEAALVPTFLLQPLVENAIEHGLAGRPSGGLISIRSRRAGGRLYLCVADNGAGLNGAKLERLGIGLGNTRNRLRELYGDAGKLDIQDSGGLIVEISFPFRLA